MVRKPLLIFIIECNVQLTPSEGYRQHNQSSKYNNIYIKISYIYSTNIYVITQIEPQAEGRECKGNHKPCLAKQIALLGWERALSVMILVNMTRSGKGYQARYSNTKFWLDFEAVLPDQEELDSLDLGNQIIIVGC